MNPGNSKRALKKNTPWQLAFNDELHEIRKRRRIAFEITGEEEASDEVSSDSTTVENLTGLSLSGGGIRSAIFNDGLLQALSHRGMLRYVDYLSTVSGGGYIGGHLISSGVEKQKQAEAELKEANKSTCEANQQFPNADSAQSVRSKSFHADRRFWEMGKDPVTGKVDPDRLNNVGTYLAKSHVFVARYFTTQIFVFLVYIGIVGIFATLAALFWRSLDHESFKSVWNLYGLNTWGGEISLSFYPTFWLVSIWLASSLLRALFSVGAHFRENTRVNSKLASRYEVFMQTLGYLIIVSVLISIAVVMGNGLTSSNPNGLLEDAWALNGFAEILALLAGVTQFLVFLGRDRLFRSEQAEAQTWQRLASKFMSVGVVALLFFAMVHMMARENISGFSENRDPHLVRQDVLDWEVFDPILKDYKAWSKKSSIVSTPSDWYSEIEVNEEALQRIRELYVPVGRWQRYNSGEDLSNPQSLLANTNNEHYLNRSFIGRLGDFFVISAYWLSCENFETSSISEIRVANQNLNKKRVEFLKLFNKDLLSSPKFTLQLLPIKSGDNNFIKSEIPSTPEISSYLKTLVDNKEASRLSSQIETVLRDDSLNAHQLSLKQESIIITLLEAAGEEVTPETIENLFSPESNGNKYGLDPVLKSKITMALQSSTDVNRSSNVATINRKLLDLRFPRAIKPTKITSTSVVNAHDQQARWGWLYAFIFLFTLGLLGTWNHNWQNSIFQFYRRSLEQKFLCGWHEKPRLEQETENETMPPSSTENSTSDLDKTPLALSDCIVTRTGLPYPLLVGTWMQREADGPVYKPFVFSPNKIGITDRNEMIKQDQSEEVECADQYQLVGMNRTIQLSDAIAISGSAVTPLMTNSVWLASIIDFFGVGLGQWMRKPNFDNPNKRILSLGYLGQTIRYFGGHDSVGFVADGGYEDVLGAYELLRRRCELIIVSDACCNTNQDELGPLAKLLETANSNLGIQFFDLDHESPIDYERLIKDAESNLPQNHIMMRVRYPDNQGKSKQRDGLLVYLQMGITESDPIEIRQIKKKFPAFPDEPTSNQFYSREQVAAYQKLGYFIGNKICSELVRWEPEDILRAENYRRLFTFQEKVQEEKRVGSDSSQESLSDLLELSGNFFGQQLADESSDQDKVSELIEEIIETDKDSDSKLESVSDPEKRLENDQFNEAFFGKCTEETEKLRSNFEPLTSRSQPLFDVLKNRLLTGYRLACYEEDNYSDNDIFSEAVWDRNEWCFVTFQQCIRDLKPLICRISKTGGYESRLAAIQDLCVEWLRTYQTNADVAAVYRNLVFLDINGRMLSTQSNESTSKAVLDFMFRTLEIDEKTTSEDQCAAVWAAHFAVTGIACQQFHRGIPRSIFQIGGREKLTDLATSLFFAKNHLEKQVRPELPPTQHSVIDGHPYSWWQWLERKCGELAELKTGVFNNAYVESTVSFTQVLILHLQTRQKNNSTKPINGVLIRKRIFDAVNNFGIGDVEKIKSLEQVVQELFHIKVEKKPAE